MNRQCLWTLVGAGLFSVCTLWGCSKNTGGGEGMGAVPSPAHPAMRVAPTASGSTASALTTGGSGGLPHNHPPIQNRPPSASGDGIGREALTAQLAQFGVGVTFPEGWKLEGRSGMRLATVRLPRAEGDAKDGEMSIIPARGSVTDNIRRWEGQFKEKPNAQVSTRTVEGALEVTMVEIDGTFTSGGPMMSGGGEMSNTKLLGAIVQQTGESEMVFFKAWGPVATMEKWRASFEAFVNSIHVPK